MVAPALLRCACLPGTSIAYTRHLLATARRNVASAANANFRTRGIITANTQTQSCLQLLPRSSDVFCPFAVSCRGFSDSPHEGKSEQKMKIVQPKRTTKMEFSWKAALCAAAAALLGVGIMMKMQAKKDADIERKKRQRIGKSLIGGPWELVNHDGVTQTNQDYTGKWLLIYFGFTHCPDICPEEIEKMCETADLLSEAKNVLPIVPMFFSVDPARDTVAAVKKYCADFSPKLIGFTGTKEQVDKVTKTFRVYHSAGPKDKFNDYIVDHTVIMYLVDPDGTFIDYYGQNRTAKQVADAITLQQMKYSMLKKN